MADDPRPRHPTHSHDTRFLGHPTGLAVLFFTEMWERFSYYGMRAFLMIFMTATLADGGLGFGVPKAAAIYALYTSSVYLLGLPGGWFADRFVGQRKAVFVGGALIAAGHFSLAIRDTWAFYTGLTLIATGTGFLKPNISTIVGQLYSGNDNRRDSAFSIFYMGINIGALAGPFVCSFFAERVDWHLGFSMAGIGMVLGLVVYVWGGRTLGSAGLRPFRTTDPDEAARQRRRTTIGVVVVAGVAASLAALWLGGAITLDAKRLSDGFGLVLLILTIVFFGWVFTAMRWSKVERRRLVAIVILFLAASLFWAAYEQAGSSLSLFARDHTDRVVAGFEIPVGWFQEFPAGYCILLAPVFAWLWIRMGSRQPSSPAKFSLGLIFVGLGFVVMMGASAVSAGGAKVGIGWLMATYLLHVIGEMCLSPVGLSTVNKLAPARVASLMMGVWFLASAVGNYVGGRGAGLYEALSLWQLFGLFAGVSIAGGLMLAMVVRPIRRLMGGIH